MLPGQVSSHDGKEMEVLGWFHQGPSVEQNLGEVVSVPGDRSIPDLRSSVSAFPFHRGRRPRCGVRGRRPHRPGHSRPPTAAPETPGGRGASEPSPVTPAETRGETSVMVGIWGSSQSRVWVGVPVSRKLPGTRPRPPRAARCPTRGHVLPLVDQDGASSRVSRCGPARRVLAGPSGQTPAPFYAW